MPQEVPLSTAVWQMGRISGLTRGLESGDVRLIAAACDDKIQEPYRRELIPDYDEVREVCLNGGAATLWISGSGSTLMAVTDDGLVAESLRARLQSMHPDFQVHVLGVRHPGSAHSTCIIPQTRQGVCLLGAFSYFGVRLSNRYHIW